MIAHVGRFQGQVGIEGMLQVQSPVPHVRRGEILVHRHDGARTLEAIDRAAAVEGPVRCVPGRGVAQEILYRDVSRGNRAAGCISRTIDRSSRRNTARTESIIEGDE